MFDCPRQIKGIRRRVATGPRHTAVISCGVGVWSLWSVSHAAPRPLVKRIKKSVSYRYRIRLTAKNRCVGIGRKWHTRSNTNNYNIILTLTVKTLCQTWHFKQLEDSPLFAGWPLWNIYTQIKHKEFDTAKHGNWKWVVLSSSNLSSFTHSYDTEHIR